MKIYVVKTCDGPAYFQGDRNRYKDNAIRLAVSQVLHNDLSRYDSEDVEKVREAFEKCREKQLLKILKDIGALSEHELRTE